MPGPVLPIHSDLVASLKAALDNERTALAAERARVAELEKERDLLRSSRDRLLVELELLRRRIFVAKAERVDTTQLEMDFLAILKQLDEASGTTPEQERKERKERQGPDRDKKKPTGRRDLSLMDLPEERLDLFDEVLEKVVAEGKAKRVGWTTSHKLAYQRGGFRRLVVARADYQMVDVHGETQLETAPVPEECFPRSLASPSALAHVISDKFTDGLPFNRQESRAARDGAPLDRGTMCRWSEDAGATAGTTVVAAMLKESLEKAFCIATDATGVAVQPDRKQEGGHQPCRRGHYFVLLADRDHVIFEYTPRETSAWVQEMFKGFRGYLQADAKSVYDIVFREPDKPPDEHDVLHAAPTEVGCWSHARRKVWEATCAKSEVAREGLARIGRIFALEAAWRGEAHDVVLRKRQEHLRPHLESFFSWASVEFEKVKEQRGLLRSALGYAIRQEAALMRVLEDGRLVLDNNRSERALRQIAVGRKAWLFVGSDNHARSSGHLLSLVASCRLHGLDPERYLRDLFRVLAHWPRDRYLELAPKYWARTRACLDPTELGKELGPLHVPPPLPAQEQPAAE